jgi:tRNA pseudouridine55 synthase
VAAVRRITGEKRVGHAGTLDPLAEGVLPVCVGCGTRVQEFLLEGRKVYRAVLKLGEETDTCDAEGRTTGQADASGITGAAFEEALKPFRGKIMQTPPMFSAIKQQGKRLYQLARSGVEVERPQRPVEIYRLELKDFENPLATIEVECSRGTYIRSLACDIGRALGCGAHLTALQRLKYGSFDIGDAITLEELKKACLDGSWQQYVQAPDAALSNWPVLVVADEEEDDVCHGRPLELEEQQLPEEALAAGRCRVYGHDGAFLALMSFEPESRRWHPDKVFVG